MFMRKHRFKMINLHIQIKLQFQIIISYHTKYVNDQREAHVKCVSKNGYHFEEILVYISVLKTFIHTHNCQ